MFRKALSGAAAVGAAGMIIAATASPAAAGGGNEESPDMGGVNVLSDLCVGNWNGNLVDVLKVATSNAHDTCNGSDQNPNGVNVASNVCALNWDWQGGIASGAKLDATDDHTLCNWSEDDMQEYLRSN